MGGRMHKSIYQRQNDLKAGVDQTYNKRRQRSKTTNKTEKLHKKKKPPEPVRKRLLEKSRVIVVKIIDFESNPKQNFQKNALEIFVSCLD
jgi:hypothetical protein